MRPASAYLNAARHALQNPRHGMVMGRKLVKRIVDPSRERRTTRENDAWRLASHSTPEGVATAFDADLWREAREFGADLRRHAEPRLRELRESGVELGGGGAYEFLYWLTRYRRPTVVVETGVAAGWSSQAILRAMAENGHGRLYSSDFPLFRLDDPAQHVGMLVDPELRDRWELHTDGDAVNLPRILNWSGGVDLFHYDSDKSYSGREFAIDLVGRQLSPGGLVVMDDLHNNSWFYDHVERTGTDYTLVGEAVGLLGEIDSEAAGSSPKPV